MKRYLDKEKTLQTYSNIAKSYEKNHKLLDDILVILNTFSGLVKTGKVLDIGTADGLETNYLNEKGFDITGIDNSEEFLKIAKSKYPKIRFVKMDMEDLEFGRDSFNGIWANASFVHIPKERAKNTLLGFNRILKTNGVLFVSVKFGYYNKLWVNKHHNWGERHFSHYTRNELSKLLTNTGFEVLDIKRHYPAYGGNSWLNVFCRKL